MADEEKIIDPTQTPEVQSMAEDKEAKDAFNADIAQAEFQRKRDAGELTPEQMEACKAIRLAMGFKEE